jgi:uncharacterized protein (TIGR01777 family)
MKVVIAGGTGFLGHALARALAADGRDIVVLTRDGGVNAGKSAGKNLIRFVQWNPGDERGPWTAEVERAAVVNLAGEPIGGGGGRCSEAEDPREPRAPHAWAAVRGAGRPAVAFISGSAVGYYGPLHDEVVREDHAAGSDFLAQVCEQWESEAVQGVGGSTRVALIRTGLTLEKDGGALPRMLMPFKLGLGGPLGSGRQYWPWIHRADWVALVRWALDTPSATGAINATAPHPVTNAEFTRALGRTLHRPAFLPAPSFALRIALGEMADALLLSGQNAVPAAPSG